MCPVWVAFKAPVAVDVLPCCGAVEGFGSMATWALCLWPVMQPASRGGHGRWRAFPLRVCVALYSSGS